MAIYIARYRCRRCQTTRDGLTFEPGAYESAQAWLDRIVHEDPQDSQKWLLECHSCPDGGYGVSDLIGADIREG